MVTDVGVEITPDIIPVPAPSKVRPYAPLTAPLQVNVPDVVAVIVLAEPKVSAPLYVALPPVFVKAPAGEDVNPVPFNINGSAVARVYPFRSRQAPLDTVVLPAIVPNGELLPLPAAPNFSVPALMVVAPVYVLAPESVHVPVPFLVTDVGVEITPDIVPEPAPSKVRPYAPLTAPLQVNVPDVVAVIVLAEPKVSAPLYVALPPVFVKAPAGKDVNPVPFNVNASAVARVYPFRSRQAPLDTVVLPAVVPNGELLPLPAEPNFNVPALIVVDPVYVLAPESVHVPVPVLVTVPEVVPIILAILPLPEPPMVKP